MTSTAHGEGWATYVELKLYEYAREVSTDGKFIDVMSYLYHNQLSGFLLETRIDAGIHCEGWKVKDVADYMKSLKLNASNTITIQLTDDYGSTISVSCTVYVYDMYVTLVGTDMILPQEKDYSFQVCPYGGLELANRSLVFELR